MDSMFLTKWVLNWPNLAVIFIGIVLSVVLIRRSIKDNSQQLRSYVPSIWTSLGILGTFICICFGLGNITPDSQFDIISVIQQIVPAFSTSIIGIIGAIVTSIFDRWQKSSSESKENQTMDSFADGNSIEKPDSAEILLLGYIREIYNEIHDNNASLKSLIDQNDAIKTELKSHVTAAFIRQHQVFNDACKTLSTEFLKAVKLASDNHTTNVAELHKEFKEELERRDKNHERFIAGLNTLLINHIDRLNIESDDRTRRLKEYIGKSKESFKEYVGGQNQLLEKILSDVRQSLGEILSDMKKLFTGQIQETINKFADEQRDGCSAIIKEQQNKFIQVSTELLNALSKSLNGMSNTVITSVYDFNISLQQNLEILYDESQKKTNTTLDEIMIYFADLTIWISKICKQISKDVDNSYGELQTFIQNNGNSTKDEIKEVGSNLKIDIKKAYTDFNTAFKELCDDNKKFIADSVKKEITDFIHSYEKNLNRIAETINDNNKKMATDLGNLHMEISTTSSELTNKFVGFSKLINKAIEDEVAKYKSIGKQVVKSSESLVQSMSETIKDSLQVEKLKSECKSLSENIHQTISELDKYSKTTQESLFKVVDSMKSYSALASNTEQLNKYINTTIKLYKEHSNTNATIKDDITVVVDNTKAFSIELQKAVSSMEMVSNNFSSLSDQLSQFINNNQANHTI